MAFSFIGTWKLHNPTGQNFVISTIKEGICVFILVGYYSGVLLWPPVCIGPVPVHKTRPIFFGLFIMTSVKSICVSVMDNRAWTVHNLGRGRRSLIKKNEIMGQN